MSFNPSVGILWVQTARRLQEVVSDRRFQSLSRDSMGSDANSAPAICREMNCFNPSVGILWVQTAIPLSIRWYGLRFQSLSRDSMGSDVMIRKSRRN